MSIVVTLWRRLGSSWWWLVFALWSDERVKLTVEQLTEVFLRSCGNVTTVDVRQNGRRVFVVQIVAHGGAGRG